MYKNFILILRDNFFFLICKLICRPQNLEEFSLRKGCDMKMNGGKKILVERNDRESS